MEVAEDLEKLIVFDFREGECGNRHSVKLSACVMFLTDCFQMYIPVL